MKLWCSKNPRIVTCMVWDDAYQTQLSFPFWFPSQQLLSIIINIKDHLVSSSTTIFTAPVSFSLLLLEAVAGHYHTQLTISFSLLPWNSRSWLSNRGPSILKYVEQFLNTSFFILPGIPRSCYLSEFYLSIPAVHFHWNKIVDQHMLA